MKDRDLLLGLHNEIATHAAHIEDLFNGPVGVTIVVRNKTVTDGSRDAVVTNDSIDAAVAALERSKTLEEVR